MTGDLPADSGNLSIREPPRVLVPIAVLEGQTIPQSLVEFLAPAEVVILGYHVVPEQTPTEQASMQFEERAQAAVEDIAHTFGEAGRDAETRVVFTHDRDATIERVADEIGATAVLLPNPTGDIAEILVPLRGAVDVGRLADLVATLLQDGTGRVTLWSLAADAEGEESLLSRAERTLRERGVLDEQIRTESGEAEMPVHAIVDRSGEFDVIVMGEGEETLLTTVLGDAAERIAEGAVSPLLVVRRRESLSADE
jgi:nucleotide-binding universal stress UspA family protein